MPHDWRTKLPAPQVAEAETERYLLFEAITGLLSAASRQQPLVLILDDLQWAGTPERLLLKHILRSPLFAAQRREPAISSPSPRPGRSAWQVRLCVWGGCRRGSTDPLWQRAEPSRSTPPLTGVRVLDSGAEIAAPYRTNSSPSF